MAGRPEEKVPHRSSDPRAHHRGRLGDALALALHRRTGLPLGFVGGAFFRDGERMLEFSQTGVRVGEDRILTVDGLRRLADIPRAELALKNAVEALCVLDAEEEEVRTVFAGPAGVPEDRIRHADAFLDTRPELLAAIAELRGPAPGM